MSEMELSISFPLDDSRFLRRECPYCCREFKIQLSESDLSDLVQQGIDSFLLDQGVLPANEYSHEDSGEEQMFTCPYCGGAANADSWWTQEQLAYLRVVMENVVAQLLNEHLIRPMKRTFGGSSRGPISVSFKGSEMPIAEEWISPEVDDMLVRELPCCEGKLKLVETWIDDFRCFYCGFPHHVAE